jgi:hypothetical protein
MEMITMKNDFGIRFRFDERAYLYNKMKAESSYITDEDINSILDEHPNLQDVTIVFVPMKSGFLTNFYDNNSNAKISLGDLNIPAFDFYIKQTELISVTQEKARKALKEELKLDKRAEDCIRRIKDILYKWDDERKANKFQAAQ